MLTNLCIRNIVLIQSLDIALAEGFCVLTGETGAGKSILLDALGLALGERASATLIRHGETQGSVTATFDIRRLPQLNILLEEHGINHEGELMLRRVVFEDGKSKAFINDIPIGVNLLGDISQQLIEIHGQHDQRGLLNSRTHRFVLDQYGQHGTALDKVKAAFAQFQALSRELAELKDNESKAQADEEYVRFVLEELDRLAPEAGLEERLSVKRNALVNREKIIEAVNQSVQVLEESQVSDALRQAQGILLKNPSLHTDFSEVADMLERALIEANEALSGLQAIAGSVEESEENLESLEEWLFALRAAARKHQVASDELPRIREEMAQKLDRLANKESYLAGLEAKLAAVREEYIKAAKTLTKQREASARQLEKDLQKELAPLKMEQTLLKVEMETLDEANWSAEGTERVFFTVRTNPGAPFAPLAKIASGGELSRFMLALKVVLSGISSVPTLIFDEVDTGIGGAVADAVGRRLARLGESLQVFAITHQPQVAAQGSFHVKVEKQQGKDATTTSLRVLDTADRREELARMLAGDVITDEARQAAGRLLVVGK